MAPLTKLTKRERSIRAKYRRYVKLVEAAKSLYDRADTLLVEIARKMHPRGVKLVKHMTKQGTVTHRLIAKIAEDGQELHCIDHSAGDDTILGWGHGAVRRYELKTVGPE